MSVKGFYVWSPSNKKVACSLPLIKHSPGNPILSLVRLPVTQSYLTLCDPMDYSPPGCLVHGILQSGTLEWVAIPFSRGSSWPRGWTEVCIAGGFITIWASREALGVWTGPHFVPIGQWFYFLYYYTWLLWKCPADLSKSIIPLTSYLFLSSLFKIITVNGSLLIFFRTFGHRKIFFKI